MFSAGAELYGIGLRYNSSSTVAWIGADSGGNLIFSDAPGNNHVSITQAGNVGIGTSSPIDVLHVSTTAGMGTPTLTYHSTPGMVSFDVPGNVELVFGWLGASPYTYWLQARGNGVAEPIALNPLGGNVGIGTSSPGAPLEVNGLTRVTGSGAPASGAGLELAYTSTQAYVSSYNRSAGAWATPININGTQLWLNSLSGGPVGIGTSSPQVALHIFANAANPSFTAWNENLTINANAGGNSQCLGFGNMSAAPWGSWIQVMHQTRVSYGAALALQPLGGAVGIGTINPNYTLTVVGDCNISGTYRVNGTPLATGGITTQTKPSRALSTTYQNATGKPMFVTVTVNMTGAANAVAVSDSSSSPTTQLSYTGSNNPGTSVNGVLSFWVLPGNYYYVSLSIGSGGSGSLGNWTEWY
jgi:hypothetical protein